MNTENKFIGISDWFTIKRLKILFKAYTIILLLLAVLPINSTGSAINNTYIISVRLDYLLHFTIFLPWMFLLWKITGVSYKSNFYKTVLYVLSGLAFAAATEMIQYFLPYRAFNINDMNPFDVWLRKNKQILNNLDSLFNQHINSIEDEKLQSILNDMYNTDIKYSHYGRNNKFLVITVLLSYKLHIKG